MRTWPSADDDAGAPAVAADRTVAGPTRSDHLGDRRLQLLQQGHGPSPPASDLRVASDSTARQAARGAAGWRGGCTTRRPPSTTRLRTGRESARSGASATGGACSWSTPCSTAPAGSPTWPSGVDGIAPNVLSRRLRHLEHEGLVVATPYSRRPLRLAYELTAAGRELAGALRLLAAWGARRAPDARGAAPRRVRHAARGPLVVPDVRPARRRRRG